MGRPARSTTSQVWCWPRKRATRVWPAAKGETGRMWADGGDLAGGLQGR